MKPLLLLIFILYTPQLSAQMFTEYHPSPPYEGLLGTSIAFSDVNGDSTEDMLITGASCQVDLIAKLFTNDGTGQFTEMQDTPFEGVRQGSIAFSDVNGDDFPDVLITGHGQSGSIAKLYINDETGNFTEMTDVPFKGVSNGSIAFADVNGDGSSDVLITGFSKMGPIAKLYTNDGLGQFTEMPNTPFEGVGISSIAIADVNGDGSSDVLITGRTSSEDRIAKLYTNNGMGLFTEKTDVPFEGVIGGSVAFSDVNGDNFVDVLITGNSQAGSITKLYTNNGFGDFMEAPDMPFAEDDASLIAFADVNGDNSEDVLIIGHGQTGLSAKLYTNDGFGDFMEEPDTPFEGVYGFEYGSAAFSDVNGDGAPDVFITGATDELYSYYSDPIAKLYINEGNGHFKEKPEVFFDRVLSSSAAISDVNGDGSPDVLITGLKDFWNPLTKLYTNDGLGNFMEMQNTPFEGVHEGSIAFSDVNGDGTSDVLITGWSLIGRIAKIYTNNGLGDFMEMPDTPFEGVNHSSIAFSDVNGDGFPDVLITGKGQSGPIAKLYTNNGLGDFTEMPDTPFEGVERGSVAFSDVNGDDFPDVLITGRNNAESQITKLYTNDGTGYFTEMPGIPFEEVTVGSVTFSDINGDGTSDVLITGWNSLEGSIAKLYTNDGRGDFTEVSNIPFEAVSFGSVAFSDVNGDSFEDVLITGEGCFYNGIAKLYLNDGVVISTSKLETKENPHALIYPNPVSGDEVLIDYEALQQAELQISIYDLSGKEIQQFKRDVITGLNKISIGPLSLPRGMYLIKIEDNTYITTMKLIVQ